EGNVDLTMYESAVLNVKAGPGANADSIDLAADTGAVTLAGVIDASAAGSLDLGGGSGGDVTVEAATTLASVASITVSGAGTDGFAGNVDFEADGDILVRGPIDASAPGTSGYAGVVSFDTTAGTVDVGRNVTANGGGFGGEIDAYSFETVSVTGGKLVADGPNASINLGGCAVSVSSVASLSSQGSNGSNFV